MKFLLLAVTNTNSVPRPRPAPPEGEFFVGGGPPVEYDVVPIDWPKKSYVQDGTRFIDLWSGDEIVELVDELGCEVIVGRNADGVPFIKIYNDYNE